MKYLLQEQIKQINIEQFQIDLVEWFTKEQRDLPWRKVKDPYKIWVSEIMLQQTRVDTVLPYYERFLEKFPTMEDFADADEEAVLKIWEGLGYYSRVRNLHTAVKEVVEKYDGKVPDTKDEISKLKGVGPYTAGAILSIAYGLPEPAVDGNVMRVLSRILLIKEDIAKISTRKLFEEAVRNLIYYDNPSYFNQGLMELGALVCTPTSPACLLCPVREHCLAFDEGVQSELPIKTRKKSTRHIDLLAVVMRNENGQYLIRKRPNKGLLADLWEFPNIESSGSFLQHVDVLSSYVHDQFNVKAQLKNGYFTKVNHEFTHLTWSIDAFAGDFTGDITSDPSLKLVTEKELEQFAFPVSHQKIWKAYKKQFLND